MNPIQKFDAWLDSIKPPPSWMDVIRIALGIFIFYKGFVFTLNFEELNQLMTSSNWFYGTIVMAHYVSIVHMAGGALIALGAFTRSNCLLNIPILLGAVLLNYERFYTVDEHMELVTAIIVLSLLILFFFIGGGRYSIDELRRRDKQNRKIESSL